MSVRIKTSTAWKFVNTGANLKVKHDGEWKNLVKMQAKDGGQWRNIYTGSDQRTFAIPATYSRSFRSSSGGATGAWITNGFTNGQNAIRQGKFGGQGAYSTLGTNPFTGAQFITACYPNTYGWVGVIQFSGTGTIYDITDLNNKSLCGCD